MIWTLLLSHWRLAAWAGLGAALALALGLWRLEAGKAAQLQTQLTAAQGAKAMADAHAAAAVSAGAVVSAGAARDAATQTQQKENDHAIQAAPGAGQSLDPALNTAGRVSLCHFAEYRGSAACVQLLGPDPGGRPDADPSDGPAAG